MEKLQKPFQGSVDEHLQLLRSGSIVLQQLVNNTRIQNNKAPTMFHSGLHKRNVFVSEENPMVVTGFIDWQLTRIEPAFYYADDVPDFATLPVSNEETQTNKSAKVKELESLCSQAYVAGLALLAPRMNAARSVNETLLRPFRYCHRTWRDSLVLHMSCWSYKNTGTLSGSRSHALFPRISQIRIQVKRMFTGSEKKCSIMLWRLKGIFWKQLGQMTKVGYFQNYSRRKRASTRSCGMRFCV